MSDRIPMTPAGHTKLEAELKRLKTEERPHNVREIEEARAHGDISENAEFHAAKERQGHIEGRIRAVEDKLARAQVIDPSGPPPEQVRFGVTGCQARFGRGTAGSPRGAVIRTHSFTEPNAAIAMAKAMIDCGPQE